MQFHSWPDAKNLDFERFNLHSFICQCLHMGSVNQQQQDLTELSPQEALQMLKGSEKTSVTEFEKFILVKNRQRYAEKSLFRLLSATGGIESEWLSGYVHQKVSILQVDEKNMFIKFKTDADVLSLQFYSLEDIPKPFSFASLFGKDKRGEGEYIVQLKKEI